MKPAFLVCSLIAALTVLSLARAQTNAPSVTNPALSLTPTNLNFGVVAVGQSSNLTVIVQNLGDGTLTGTATTTAPFSIVSGGSYTLATQQSQAVTVRYSPTEPGTNSQALNFIGGGGATINACGQAAVPPPPPTNLRVISAM